MAGAVLACQPAHAARRLEASGDVVQRLLPARLYYGWVMVASALAINTASSPLNAVVFSFLVGPISADLGVTKSALGWALTLRLIAAALTGPSFGVLIDRHGARWLGAACGAVGGVALIVLGSVHALWAVYVVFAFSGLSGFGGPAGQLLTQVPLARWFVVRRGRMLAIATTGMALGTVFAIPLTQWLIESVGWRSTTTILGSVVAGVIVPVSILFVRRAPEDLGLHPDGAPAPPSELPAAGRAARLTTTRDWTVAEALRTPAAWLMLAAMTLQGVALMGTLIYRVDFWQSTGMAPALVGFGTALDPLCVVFSVLAFGLTAERIPIRYIGFIGVMGLAASIFPLVVSSGQTWTILAHSAIWGTSAGAWVTLNSLIWPNYFGRLHLGAIRGIVLPVQIGATSIGAPLFGYLFDSGMAPSHVWGIALGSFAGAACLLLLARPPRTPLTPARAVAFPATSPSTSRAS